MSRASPRPTTTTTSFTAPSHESPAAGQSVDPNGPHPSTTASDAPQSFGTTSKKRGSSSRPKPLSAKQIPRAHYSTPQLQEPAMSDAEGDKKRNRLGYQRISIACAHCRRRKIRCVAPDDPARGRCANCARLNKECVYSPVEQQNASEEGSNTSSKKGKQSASSSATSPTSPYGGDAGSFAPSAPPLRAVPTGQVALPQNAFGNVPTAGFSQDGLAQVHQAHPEYRLLDWQPGAAAAWTQANSQSLASPGGPHSSGVDYAPFQGSYDHPQESPRPMDTNEYIPQGLAGPWHQPHAHAPIRSMSHPTYPSQAPFQTSQPPPGAYQFADPHPAPMQPQHQNDARFAPVLSQPPGVLGDHDPRHGSIPQMPAYLPHAPLPPAPQPQSWYESMGQHFATSAEEQQQQLYAQHGFTGYRPPNPG